MKANPNATHGRIARPPPARSSGHGASHAHESGGWLGAGLFRIFVFGAIVIGGIAVLLWLRDMGSAAGVNWLH